MFNIKKMPFIKKLKSKEINYTLKLLDRYEYSNEIKKLVYEFVNTTSHSDLQKFVDSQDIFKFSTKINIIENFDEIKEKMAYELNEQLLKLAF
jgi:hypothetical protein